MPVTSAVQREGVIPQSHSRGLLSSNLWKERGKVSTTCMSARNGWSHLKEYLVRFGKHILSHEIDVIEGERGCKASILFREKCRIN